MRRGALCGLVAAPVLLAAAGCGAQHRAGPGGTSGEQAGAAGFLTTAAIREIFGANGIHVRMEFPGRRASVLRGDIRSLGLRGIGAVMIDVYLDELTARYAPGKAEWGGRPGTRYRVRNVLVWIRPYLPDRARGRVRAALDALRRHAAAPAAPAPQ